MNPLFKISTKALYPYWNNRLTVLMYHRVRQIVGVPFSEYEPTISATPLQFAEQMAYVRYHFNPISLDRLVGWLHGDTSLPDRPLLITFDDGYRDNFDTAFPILRKHELPGVFFLATAFIGSKRPFDWDLAAYCFHNTQKRQAHLPIAGFRTWKNALEKDGVMNEWIRLLLQQPDRLRREAVENLPPALEVSIPEATFRDLCMTWDQVRNLAAAGMDIGSHTRNHVMLDRTMPAQVREEMFKSRRHIEKETGLSVNAFAYPNGVFNAEIEAQVNDTGYDVAFSTRQGPSTLSTVASHPLSIERVAVSHKDHMARFLAKLAGLPRLKRRVKKKN